MSSAPPRRFKVEPFETKVYSSKDASPECSDTSKSRRRFAPTPIETSMRTNRTFVPEPIETSVRSSRNRDAQEPTKDPKPERIPHRRRKSQDKFDQEWQEWQDDTTQKFKPERIPHRRRKSQDKFDQEWKEWQNDATGKFKSSGTTSSTATETGKRPPRKFAPLLIETAQRSRKAGDNAPAVLPSDKTEVVPGQESQIRRRTRTRPVPPPPENTPTVDITQNPLFLEIQRATSPTSTFAMHRRNSRCSLRSHHSFRVPDLDPIESSESEGSSPPSPTTSPSVASDHSFMYTEATRMRESVDERFSGYLLELAAKAAEKQLRDQAMAAFPNDDHHEPVDHFIGRDSDEAELQVEELKRRRESSFTEVNWELVAMQKHRANLEQQQQNEREQKKRQEAEMNRPVGPKHGPWANAIATVDSSAAKNIVGGWQKDDALDCMRKGARPPMLGGEIKFPRCPSPEPARFDTTQGTDAVRIAMCYLSEQSQQAEKGEGLWCGGNSSKQSSARPSLYFCSAPASRRPSRGGGLWGGCCVSSGLTPPRGPTGILTPSLEIGNPFSPCPTPATSLLPPTPPASNADFACIDEKLAAEAAIDEEFGDDFITQVYNYLSLGYPSLARDFDDELSKIAHIPVAELRQDDHVLSSKGYIRLGEDGNLKHTAITEETCMRWQALRVYIREWAKQQPGMAADTTAGGIGVAVRKGSWAI